MSTHFTADMHDTVNNQSSSRLSIISWFAMFGGVVILGLLIYSSISSAGHAAAAHKHAPPLWGLGILPFAALLGCIAVLPLIPKTHHWWESNLNKIGVSMGLAGLTLAYYLWQFDAHKIVTVLEHAIIAEYIPFIVLLFALYVISGGICLKGDLAAHPLTNTTFLAIGALIASFIGTTGASMLLIRPLLQTNSERKHVIHTVIFFIFLVSNIGGTLLPIGDPPLFLGYLKGVPFMWTMGLWAPWAVCCIMLLIFYYVWDSIAYRKESAQDIKLDETQKQPLRLTGWFNILILGGIVLCVAVVDPHKTIPYTNFTPFPFMRELLMIGLVGISLFITPKGVRAFNKFNYAAIIEVAALFIGIFITMQVAVEFLNAKGATLGIDEPWKFFWATGSLSGILDNAPTYVVFFETAKVIPPVEGAEMVNLGAQGINGAIRSAFLVAISLGAVFMGAMTYIGNGPNFMVKAIAEQTGLKMPSFFGYMVKYSLPILLPIFLIIMLLFLMPWSPLRSLIGGG